MISNVFTQSDFSFLFLHFLSFLVWMKSSICFLFTQKAKRHKLNMIQDSKGRHALKKRRKAMRGRETDFWKQTCPWYRFIQSPYLMKDISIDPLHNLGCFLYVQLLLCTHRMRSYLDLKYLIFNAHLIYYLTDFCVLTHLNTTSQFSASLICTVWQTCDDVIRSDRLRKPWLAWEVLPCLPGYKRWPVFRQPIWNVCLSLSKLWVSSWHAKFLKG